MDTNQPHQTNEHYFVLRTSLVTRRRNKREPPESKAHKIGGDSWPLSEATGSDQPPPAFRWRTRRGVVTTTTSDGNNARNWLSCQQDSNVDLQCYLYNSIKPWSWKRLRSESSSAQVWRKVVRNNCKDRLVYDLKAAMASFASTSLFQMDIQIEYYSMQTGCGDIR